MTRLSALVAATTVASTDIFHLANDPSGTNIDKKITATNLFLTLPLLLGRSGGQTIIGGTGASDSLTLNSTSNVTRGSIILQPSGGNVGIGTASPAQVLHIFDGNIRMDQVAAPSAPSVATGGAGVLTGTYKYAVTFVTALGETEIGTISGNISPSSQQVSVTSIPVSSDANVTSRNLYRSTAGGATSTMKLVATIADNTTTVYTDNIADGSLTTPISYKNTTGGRIIVNSSSIVATWGTTFVGIGNNAGQGTGGLQSVAVGTSSMSNMTTASSNTAVGYVSMSGVTTGTGNAAFGAQSGRFNQTGSSNTWVGDSAGVGVSTNSNSSNTGVGASAGIAITTGSSNVLLGILAGSTLTTGSSNIIIGNSINTPANNTANFMSIGNVLFGTGVGSTTGTTVSTTGKIGINVASPAQALHILNGHLRIDQIAEAGAPTAATGAAGVLTGAYQYAVTFVTPTGETSVSITTGFSGVVNPSSQQVALTAIPTSSDSSVTSRKIYRTTAGGLTRSMKLVTTIADNTTTTYNDNIADGSLTTNMPFKNTTGGEILIGTSRIAFSDQGFTGFGVGAGNGTAIGGSESVAFGASSLTSLTVGYQNSAIGYSALSGLTTGVGNVATGYASGLGLTTGGQNTYVGSSSGRNNVTGNSNTWIGYLAGQGVSANSNSSNTGLGREAGTAITTGNNNIFIGYRAGDAHTTGSNNIVIGYDIDTPSGTTSNQMTIGNLIFSAGVNATGTSISTGNIGIGVAAPLAKLHISAASSAMSSATWTTTGKIFATEALSITNTTSTGTVALQVEHSFGIPTLLASSSTTLTMSANVYIAGAPIASTNVTQTDKTGLFIDTGAAAAVGMVLRGASAQAGDMIQLKDNSNNTQLSVTLAYMTSQVAGGLYARIPAGAVGTPTYSFTTDTTSGMYRVGAGSMGFSSAGTLITTIDANGLTMADAKNIIVGSTTGTKIGTATSQKIGLWNTAPDVQPTTGIAAAAFVANTSAIANDSATFGGYTIGQIVAALKRLGALA